MIEQFAVIVGLLSAFSSGREAKAALDIAEFQGWLTEHNHEDIVQLLNSDMKTNIFVKSYLNQQIPEIQSKLDTIINLVQLMANDGDSVEVEYSGKHYLKGIALLGLERVIHSNLSSDEFDIAHSYVVEMIGDDVSYNKYVLEKMVKDCLLRKNTASDTLNIHWLELTGYS
jgi:hypothetical protein